ncbi:MAG: bifunctional oligoribonuclease/PAP phosphatase NrnA [Clostridia bacterium]|nr:bifunctional oligoribonuclease/PAP phosphatase NrnA [Clostridia bacterium]
MDYRKLTMQETLERLLTPAPTCILFHVNPDADAVGSAFALAEFLKAQGSDCYCVCANEVPERLQFLADGVQKSVLPTSIPAEFENARIITVDTASPAQLGALYEPYGDRISLMIDHHGKGTPYADNLILPEAAACGEIIFDLIAESGKDAPETCAALLYAAISSDTGGFRYSNTTKDTHLRVAALVEGGVDVAEISRKLFETKSMQTLRAEQLALERLRLYENGRIAIAAISYDDKQFNKLEDEHLSTVVDVARSVAGVAVAVAIRQPGKDGIFRVSMRANEDIDVSEICAIWGGGGHKRAAGATLSAAGIADAEARVLAEIVAKIG